MVLYIDETENADYFIVTGLLASSTADVKASYKRFKNKAQKINIPSKYKGKVFTEFKSTILDRDYSRIKRYMLEEIAELDGAVIYSCRLKKTPRINQVVKESIYITLLSSILSELKEETTVIFDRFGKPDFEEKIIKSAEINTNITDIYACDSQMDPGLQFADNLCSVIRHHKAETDIHNFYEIIERLVREV